MNGLNEQFSDRVDFVALNIDREDTLPIRQRFNMIQRSQYALIDAQGNVIQRWFGLLDASEVQRYLTDYLAGQT